MLLTGLLYSLAASALRCDALPHRAARYEQLSVSILCLLSQQLSCIEYDAVSISVPCMLQGPQRGVCLHGIPQRCHPRPPTLPDPQPPQIDPIRCQQQNPHGKTLGLPQNPHGRTPNPWPPCAPLLLLQQERVTPLQGSHPPRLPSPATKGVPMTCCQTHSLVACRQVSTQTHLYCSSLLPCYKYFLSWPCV